MPTPSSAPAGRRRFLKGAALTAGTAAAPAPAAAPRRNLRRDGALAFVLMSDSSGERRNVADRSLRGLSLSSP